MKINQIILSKLPKGKLDIYDFSIKESDLPSAKDGEISVRTLYIALDAASRAWMQGDTYRPALQAGEVMAGIALAEVIESHVPHLVKGDLVIAETGWQTHATLSADTLFALPELKPLTYLLSIYGVPGLTAYFGLLRCGKVEIGNTVVVSAAAGAVGSIVGQIAKIKGCRVIGIAGSTYKCSLLTKDFGFDEAIDYSTENLEDKLRLICPDGIDIYFDNVGGNILDAALSNMKKGGRIVCCGAISQYDSDTPKANVIGVPGQLILKSLTMNGFLLFDYLNEQPQAFHDLSRWVSSGKLRVVEEIVEGLEQLPKSLVGLLNGENIGKRIVKIADI
ncbi:NADP-dependent oxidoreductase [Acinetobacter baumannii]|uniref:NADP-dependent oxidoreductase n=1 Tax=Acinetobacter baumannii TaxID=470 RepID=UPI0021C86276|nr:NADP-dependent oxidoreductase [Acinetobacter baumannii]